MEKRLNRYYMGSMGFFFAMFSSMFSFISVFLLHKGFDNTSIGTILSITGIVSIFLQTVVANYLDKKQQVRVQDVLMIYGLMITIFSVALYFTDIPIIITLLMIVIFAFAQSSESLLNASAFVFEPFDIYINYGFARGVGSFAFAATTLFLGFVTEQMTPEIIPLFYALFASGIIFTIYKYKHPQEKTENVHEQHLKHSSVEEEAFYEPTLAGFVSRNKNLMFLMLGVVFLLFTHTMINNFFIQIITPIGGNTATMGTAIFFGAMLELPAMIKYDQLEAKISAPQLLKVAGVFFIIKHTLTYFAPNMLVIYIAQFFQIGSFALIIPAGVSYIRSVVSKKDMLKGQSLFTNALVLSSVSGSFLGGYLLDNFGIEPTLFVGIVATLIGTIIVFIATLQIHSKNSNH